MTILGIDTSGKGASAALCSENEIIGQYFVQTGKTHSQVILPLCKKLVEDAGMTLNDIDVFAAADGPGSYTGLRIGISAVKAMAYGLGKKCIGISTLEAIAYNFAGAHEGYVCCVMKARLDIVYCAVFMLSGGKVMRCTQDLMKTRSELDVMLCEYHDRTIIVSGDAAEDFIGFYGADERKLAPLHLRYQLASGICMCALDNEPGDPDELNARYMQITKAEKDLLENK
ncbi:MAG: tRNA (adenosine(37)-N6)-threonylcarbamoyltransferase complex dimerization subunit type 1 TsaB [Oscillospiraceae bacterium]|nr:tRNA (adenosine(37)-N6)-threonylcarbamoyltransferase complex dimerization subunit type 1 TsaB [Oscillospiraceae bacterium]